eukprot:6463843-Pyramimonas_sp.AAC.1
MAKHGKIFVYCGFRHPQLEDKIAAPRRRATREAHLFVSFFVGCHNVVYHDARRQMHLCDGAGEA